jgi:hypothetical protein
MYYLHLGRVIFRTGFACGVKAVQSPGETRRRSQEQKRGLSGESQSGQDSFGCKVRTVLSIGDGSDAASLCPLHRAETRGF